MSFAGPQVFLVSRDHPRRNEVEAGIAAVYARHFGARLGGFPDRLVCLFRDDTPVCAAGLRDAAEGFFCDCYMDRPLAELLAPGPVVEVGPLAAIAPGGARLLVDYVTTLCLDAGAAWAVFTATVALRDMLLRRGLPLADLGPARRDRVRDPESWGRYYDHDPRVCVVARDALPVRAA